MAATDFLQAYERMGLVTPETMCGIGVIGSSALLNATVDHRWRIPCGRECRGKETAHRVFKMAPVLAAVPGLST